MPAELNNNETNKQVYQVKIVTEHDKKQVIDFLNKFFFKDEPLNNAVQLHLHEQSIKHLAEFSARPLSMGLSLAAVLPNGEIIGLSINQTITKAETANVEIPEVQEGFTFSKILRLLKTICKESNVFGHFPQNDKLLDILILSVDDSYRGLGICKALIQKTKEIAKQYDFHLLKVDCTSHYSAKAALRLGFRSIYTLPYKNFTDKNGIPYITPELPHTCAQTFVMDV